MYEAVVWVATSKKLAKRAFDECGQRVAAFGGVVRESGKFGSDHAMKRRIP
jgi:hypothetical protein